MTQPAEPKQAVLVWRWPTPEERGIPANEPISTLRYPEDREPINELLKRAAADWLEAPDRRFLPAPRIVDFTEERVGDIAHWADLPTGEDAVRDHERNPEYEVHLGQVTADGRRLASIWLQGERWSGWLSPGPPPSDG